MGNKLSLIASCYNVNEKSLNTWKNIFESYGTDSIEDNPRNGRPTKLQKEQGEVLKKMIEEDNLG